MGDHTETVQIEFDPKIISFKTILELFWNQHNPKANSKSPQYQNVIFHNSEEQLALINETKPTELLATLIKPEGPFFLAEGYHQKYNLRRVKALERVFSNLSLNDLINSAAATRMNGFVSRGSMSYDKKDDILAELPSFGLDDKSVKKLKAFIDRE